MRAYYSDFLGAHAFLTAARDACLASICSELGVTLLGPPDPAWANSAFTPRALMRDSDGVHGTIAYGAMVLGQVREALGMEANPDLNLIAQG